MSIARKIMLLVGMALAAMAMTATTASAQESEVEIVNEETGNPCVGCVVHIEGESHVRAMPAGVIVSACHDEFRLTINHNNSGEVEWTGVTSHGAPGCTTVNCEAGDEDHWPISGFGEEGNGTEHVTIRFCLRAGTAELHCDGRIRVNDTGDHHYALTTNPASGLVCAGGARIVEGSWEAELPHNSAEDDEMSIVHHVN